MRRWPALSLALQLGPRGRVNLLAAGVGIAAGAAAAALARLLHLGADNLIGRFAELGGPAVLTPSWPLLLMPCLGGLVSGLVVQRIADLPPQQGTDQMVTAFHTRDGVLPLRGPSIRAAAAAWVISCGGSAGPEGPTAGLGAAIGSSIGQFFGVKPRERRSLLIAGCAAGVGAIFHCPLGGALFATSVLYRRPEFEGSALVPAFVASAAGYAAFLLLGGFEVHLFEGADRLVFRSALDFPAYLLLGLACGGAAMLFGWTFRSLRGAFARMTGVPLWLRPAVGGLLTGAVACLLPQVMDGEYRMVKDALDGSLFAGDVGGSRSPIVWAALLAAIVGAKCLATGFTAGSGASGGLLGPSLFLGGAVGALLGSVATGALPDAGLEPLRQAMIPVGMAGVLAGTMRTPIAAIVMVVEMTGSFGLIVPLMLVSVIAYGVARRHGVVDAQLASAADSPTHAGDLLVNLLEQIHVREVASQWPARVARWAPLAQIIALLPKGQPPMAVVVEHERVRGLISFAELRAVASEADLLPIAIAEDLMSERFETVSDADTLYDALEKLERLRAEALPALDAEGRFAGMLTRSGAYSVISRKLAALRKGLLREHAGLAAFEEHGRLAQLVAVLPAAETSRIDHLAVPREWVGLSLRDIDLRRTRGTTVLAVHAADERFLCPPDPSRPLAPGDRLVLLSGGEPTPEQQADATAGDLR